ncbi:hypothetical protein [Haloarchaeobius litoreus]|uniref:Uncharacterized protein n=1 Tax=Haloarchaeobius litoreus TaxID=755306 RepID=A0ABD6DK02_9EURY|nr:hypothetical protein [Haloarchaeobius litoreus]
MKDRGILTERDREILQHDPTNDRRPVIRSHVRKRIERLEQDLEILDEEEPELADQLREQLCIGTQHAAVMDVLDDIQRELEAVHEDVKD